MSAGSRGNRRTCTQTSHT